jgi:PAS domain S-box-containing protein
MVRPELQNAAAEGGFSQDQLLAALLGSSDDAIIAKNLGGTIQAWNKGATDMYGYSEAEAIGQPMSMLSPPDRKSEISDLLGRIGQGERIAHHETVRQGKDGVIFPVSVSISPIRDADGTIVGASSIARALSAEQLQAAQSQARLASIVEFSRDAIMSVGLDGVIDTWNAGAERVYGYTAAEAIGRGADLMVPAEQLTTVYNAHAAMAKGERMEEYQAERVRKDGTRISVMVTFTSLADSTGAITGMSAVVRDITAQQAAAARFRGLLEAAPDAMVCADSGGRIVLVNAAAERLFGYPREDLTGQLVEMLVPDASKAAHPALRARYSADPQPRLIGKDQDQDLSGRRRDGSTFPAEIALSALDTDQGTLTSAAIRDVTIQRQARQELQRANRNLQSLVYSVSHDLRTPLRSLEGFSSALAEEYSDALGETGRDYTRRIGAASQHIGDVLDSLEQLSRIGQAEVTLQRVDLGGEAAAIAGELQRQDPDRRVAFTIQQPAWVLADPALIRDVLYNLLGNAWKFTAGRDVAVIEFGMTPVADARVSCYVRDNGAGFDPAYAGKLFTQFERLHTAREFPGTGIGLAVVRQIVDLHGGRTQADGAVGHGATFSFDLRAAEPASQPDK